MAFALQQQMRAVSHPAVSRRNFVIAKAKPSAAKASLAAGAAALMLVSSTPALAVDAHSSYDTVTTIAATNARYDDKGPFTSLFNSIPSIFPKVNEDPFGADRKQEKTVGDTKRPIAIPTEQEAVAPEAFPNPSEAYSPRPPVLAAAEGDENLGENAGQFKDLDASGRQALIDKKSPAESSTN